MTEKLFAKRFRGFLPVVVDLETGGFNCKTDALLEIAIVMLQLDDNNMLHRQQTFHYHVEPFQGANMEPASMAVNRIDPYHPFRFAVSEKDALLKIFSEINTEISRNSCQRAVLVGHNPWFDLSFIKAASKRCGFRHQPFHSFTTFDTATLAAMAYGETILVKAALAAGLGFDPALAHSAIYDAEKTADLFCKIMNLWNASQLMLVS